MQKTLFKFFTIISLFVLTNTAIAELHLTLTQGVSAPVPIAIVPFAGQVKDSPNDPNNIAAVIQNDLTNSGRFNVMPTSRIEQFPSDASKVNFDYWKKTGNEYLVVGNINSVGGNSYQVTFALLNNYGGAAGSTQTPIIISKRYDVNQSEFRQLAHRISDLIFQQITGVPGIFSTKIAYILVQRRTARDARYMLEVADADGFNPRTLVASSGPLMSPSWSRNGREIAYVSLANQRSSVYVVNVADGSKRLISDIPGINSAPAWSPDGSTMALVLSKDNSPKIYTYSLGSGQLKQLTFGNSIDTEPYFAPDGKSIIFTSDRGGGPQIYRYFFGSGSLSRITFDGKYNATPSFTSDGKKVVVLHQDGEGYNIAVQSLDSGALTVLTTDGYDSSPSVAPNGQMVIYATNRSNQSTLGIVSIDGKVRLKLPAPEGSVQEPAWSPFVG